MEATSDPSHEHMTPDEQDREFDRQEEAKDRLRNMYDIPTAPRVHQQTGEGELHPEWRDRGARASGGTGGSWDDEDFQLSRKQKWILEHSTAEGETSTHDGRSMLDKYPHVDETATGIQTAYKLRDGMSKENANKYLRSRHSRFQLDPELSNTDMAVLVDNIDLPANLDGEYNKPGKKEVLVAIRGSRTDFKEKDTWKDWIANSVSILPGIRDWDLPEAIQEVYSPKFERDDKLFRLVLKKYVGKGNIINVAGHSLGGSSAYRIWEKYNAILNRADIFNAGSGITERLGLRGLSKRLGLRGGGIREKEFGVDEERLPEHAKIKPANIHTMFDGENVDFVGSGMRNIPGHNFYDYYRADLKAREGQREDAGEGMSPQIVEAGAEVIKKSFPDYKPIFDGASQLMGIENKGLKDLLGYSWSRAHGINTFMHDVDDLPKDREHEQLGGSKAQSTGQDDLEDTPQQQYLEDAGDPELDIEDPELHDIEENQTCPAGQPYCDADVIRRRRSGDRRRRDGVERRRSLRKLPKRVLDKATRVIAEKPKKTKMIPKSQLDNAKKLIKKKDVDTVLTVSHDDSRDLNAILHGNQDPCRHLYGNPDKYTECKRLLRDTEINTRRNQYRAGLYGNR